jgi:hypothetical protein
VPSHGYCGLPASYDKNLRQIEGLVPLTIFNPIWQQQAAAYASKKKVVDQGSSEERRHTGHPAPSEWSQSYAQWARNYQCFLKTLREVYDYGKLADWALIHRDRVDAIMLKHEFCTGLHYDLAVQSNAFQCNTIHKGDKCFPDISKNGKGIATKTFHDVKARDKTQYQENPYIKGGPREDIDPYTGQTRPNVNCWANDRGRHNQGGHGGGQGNRYEPYASLSSRGCH